MGPFGMIVSAILGVKVLNAIADHNNEKQRKEEEREWKIKQKEWERERQKAEEQEKLRRETPCEFNDGFTEEEFEETVQYCAKKIRRIKSCTVDGLNVVCRVTSQSGISDWSFGLDFRDFGHFTGRCWKWSENFDSSIPDRLKELICSSIDSLQHQR